MRLTGRAVALALLGLGPALLAVFTPGAAVVALAFDAALLALVVSDFLRAPGAGAVRAERVVQPVLSSGVRNPVTLVLELAPGVAPVRGLVRDVCPPGPEVEGAVREVELHGRLELRWTLVPLERGDLTLGPVWLVLEGPLGLAARRTVLDVTTAVRVFPDLTTLSRDAVKLARAAEDAARRRIPLASEGREFESLRDYRVGDDFRLLDWKATARRARPIVRVQRPERNQVLGLLVDCGRHMAGRSGPRGKLDAAVDAALSLAKVSLDAGDLVGVVTYGRQVQARCPPRGGPSQLPAIVQALYRARAHLEESDLDEALGSFFGGSTRRSLVAVFTDLLDGPSSLRLTRRLGALAPRHVPLVITLQDDEVHALATRAPDSTEEAHLTAAARHLEREVEGTVRRLRGAGALVVRARRESFGAAAANAYLSLKARGVL